MLYQYVIPAIVNYSANFNLKKIMDEAMQCSIANKRMKEHRDDALSVSEFFYYYIWFLKIWLEKIAGLLAFSQENENHFYSSAFLDHLLNYCTLHEFGKSKDTLTILDQFATVCFFKLFILVH